MKYWTIAFPGEFGQHVTETWSEDQIIKSYYTYWCGKMIQNVPNPDLDPTKCIEDWCADHWAVQVPKPDWITDVIPSAHPTFCPLDASIPNYK